MRLKKIDKLVFQAFMGPFVLTFVVVVFILLTTQMLRYLDEIFGKGIGMDVLGQFIFHFSVFQTPVAFPLSVMLASLIAFGNLGEHSELTAVKSAGISLTRAMFPIFMFVMILSGIAFYSNSSLVPTSALKAYSLLYDIRQKKPTLDIKEGVFYGGIDNFRIKVNKRYADGNSLKGLVIYDHSKGLGNTDVIVADSGLMYTILNDRYLKLELFDGNFYSEEAQRRQVNRNRSIKPFNRTKFERSEMIFDLSIFDLKRTKEELFATNRLMREYGQLKVDIDSIEREVLDARFSYFYTSERYFQYYGANRHVIIPTEIQAFGHLKDSLKNVVLDTISDDTYQDDYSFVYKHIDLDKVKRYTKKPELIPPRVINDTVKVNQAEFAKDLSMEEVQSIVSTINQHFDDNDDWDKVYKNAVGMSRQMKSKTSVTQNRNNALVRNLNIFSIQYFKMIATAFACVTMFLIGAPLGAIIKKGGLGFPVLISIIFFIIYYVISLAAEKQARQDLLDPLLAVWIPNIILAPIGLFFLRQARKDARLFETDYYLVNIDKLRMWFLRLRGPSKNAA
jgi:lipopolysaccharide export system permease protein